MAKIKLTRIELSTILSAADKRQIDFNDGNVCYAGQVYGGHGYQIGLSEEDQDRWQDISDAIINAPANRNRGFEEAPWYTNSKQNVKASVLRPRNAEDALRACRNAGLV